MAGLVEACADIRTPVIDPYLDELMSMGGQDLQSHQFAAVDAAAKLVAGVPRG